MKESITKFDLEAAFKALDEIEVPKAGKVRANRPALTEIFSRKTKLDTLIEEYYDIGSNEGLEDAKEAREAEVAQAKLARIEKIVDLDAESADELLTSYVGKYIMQCPQCMTLFYKNQEDIVASEDDPATVNVNEVCQHCGNESGYTLIGKVGEAESEEAATEETPGEDDLNLEVDETGAVEETSEEPAETTSEEEINFEDELELLDLDNIEDEEEPEEEKKEEAFTEHSGEALVEELGEDKDLDKKLDDHNEYIDYLRAVIAQEEESLEKTENAQIKDAIQRRIDAAKTDLEAALPDAVKNEEAPVEEPAEEVAVEDSVEAEPETDTTVEEQATEADEVNESLTEALHEEADGDVSDAEFDELMDSPEFKKPISDTAVRAMLAMENEENKKDESLEEVFNDVDELREESLESMISDSLIELYGNVAGFRLKDCSYSDNKFMVEGVIHFTSGNTRKTTYTFNEALVEADKITLRGLNEKLGNDKQFFITGYTENKTFITESFKTAKN
jgi:hypothetical protein